MNRLLCAAFTLACIAVYCTATLAATVTKVDVLEYGLYTFDDKVVMLEKKPDGVKLSNIRQIRQTLDIPLDEQTFFSIKYVLHGNDEPQNLDIELRVTNPAGETSTGSMKARTGVPTTTNIEFTKHDLPGEYLFQVLHGDNVLLSKKINLIKP